MVWGCVNFFFALDVFSFAYFSGSRTPSYRTPSHATPSHDPQRTPSHAGGGAWDPAQPNTPARPNDEFDNYFDSTGTSPVSIIQFMKFFTVNILYKAWNNFSNLVWRNIIIRWFLIVKANKANDTLFLREKIFPKITRKWKVTAHSLFLKCVVKKN